MGPVFFHSTKSDAGEILGIRLGVTKGGVVSFGWDGASPVLGAGYRMGFCTIVVGA